MVVFKKQIPRKIIAFLSLALILVISAVKVFHVHKGFIANKSNSIDTDPIHHLHNESCNICDFHLLGSGRIAAPSFVFLGGEVREMLNGDDADFPHLDRCITDCLRGPPAFR